MIPPSSVYDQRSRPLGVLRMSLTARCNLACPYCKPDGYEVSNPLSIDQRLALIESACRLGAHSLRLTGGEPLLSNQLEPLLREVSHRRYQLGDPLAALQEVTLTTNGLLLDSAKAHSLRQAGLDRITISLDAVEAARAAEMSGQQGGIKAGSIFLSKVYQAIQHARYAGFDPNQSQLKINSVIQRRRNYDQLIPLASMARKAGLELRLIEFMDVGTTNSWTHDQVVSGAEMVHAISQRWPLEPLGRLPGQTAQRWSYRDGGGTLGVIASISKPFCSDCNRLRITADGSAYTCLFSNKANSLRPWLFPQIDLEGLMEVMASLWSRRNDHYSEERYRQSSQPAPTHADMAYLGG
ncbi:radical SAM protein [cyanobiont of Ornithocercus magnificus]|nr:radical SAM protein [cyanobiont of Ornithocercus magnificus]